MKEGLFITFEGPDGSGKSTQIKFLREHLETKGLETVLTREPGGTSISEKIREIILDKNNLEMDPLTEAFLYASSRAQHVAQLILPAIKSGKTVICDRFMDSSIAYQGYGRELGDRVRMINEIAVLGIRPDITFFLKVDPKLGKSRIKGEHDRLEMEHLDFHYRVFNGYCLLEKENPDRFVTIDGAAPIEEIKNIIRQKADEFLGKTK